MRPFTEAWHEGVRERARAFAAGLEPRGASGPEAPGRALGRAGLLKLCVPAAHGGDAEGVSPLALVVAREALAGGSAAHDAALAIQTLAALPIAWAGGATTRARWLPGLGTGDEVGAFALTERGSGSDVGALATTATPEGDGYRLDGEKVLISGPRDATVFVVFARTSAGAARPDVATDATAKRALSAFVVPAATGGLSVEETPNLGGHALGTVKLAGVRVAADARLGAEGDGLALALRTLELMRPTVGAAACGMAARALDEARALVRERRRGGTALADHESVRMRFGELATELDAARLLVYRAAWLRETTAAGTRLDAEASMAKLFATEAAGRIVDAALQLHGGAGVLRGAVVERLYREVRALRIYEGASEIHKLIIGRSRL